MGKIFIDKYLPGTYANVVNGQAPEWAIEALEDAGKTYIDRNWPLGE